MKSEWCACHILIILVFNFKQGWRFIQDTIKDFASFKVNFIVSSCCDCINHQPFHSKKKKKNNNYFIDITLKQSFRLSYFNLVI